MINIGDFNSVLLNILRVSFLLEMFMKAIDSRAKKDMPIKTFKVCI